MEGLIYSPASAGSQSHHSRFSGAISPESVFIRKMEGLAVAERARWMLVGPKAERELRVGTRSRQARSVHQLLIDQLSSLLFVRNLRAAVKDSLDTRRILKPLGEVHPVSRHRSLKVETSRISNVRHRRTSSHRPFLTDHRDTLFSPRYGNAPHTISV